MPNDVLEELAAYLGMDDPKSLAALAQSSKRFKVRISPKISKWGVNVDGQWIWWPEALKTDDHAPLVSACKDPDFLIAKLPDWDEESKRSARDGREPAYLQTLSSLTAVKVRRFLFGKGSLLTTKEGLVKHAYAVLFAMNGYISTVFESAAAAAEGAVGGKHREAARAAAYNAAQGIAKLATHKAAEAAVEGSRELALARMAARITAWCADVYPARSLSCLEASIITKGVRRESIQGDPIGTIAYRSAEKASLVYFAQEAKCIAAASYGAALAELKAFSSVQIFAYRTVWRDFKDEHFGELTPGQMLFLKVWLDELDRTVAEIEAK